MKPIDLLKFCCTEPSRFVLSKPWHHKEHTIATDGRILIRVPHLDCETEKGPERGPKLEATLAQLDPAPWELLEVPVATGNVIETKCECREYEERGRPDPECWDCDGVGFIKEWGGCPVMVGDREISGQYLKLILEELPNPKLFIPTGAEARRGPIGILFDGGMGLLMPMKEGSIAQWKAVQQVNKETAQ